MLLIPALVTGAADVVYFATLAHIVVSPWVEMLALVALPAKLFVHLNLAMMFAAVALGIKCCSRIIRPRAGLQVAVKALYRGHPYHFTVLTPCHHTVSELQV